MGRSDIFRVSCLSIADLKWKSLADITKIWDLWVFLAMAASSFRIKGAHFLFIFRLEISSLMLFGLEMRFSFFCFRKPSPLFVF
ncbi:MAG TPA: hypothetical protein DDW18_00825 [Firmicutes bacterium]|nr:hypothetical protein [Bacillota bacterium]HBN00272.1 hypothetical protein [Bacillota bacterium]